MSTCAGLKLGKIRAMDMDEGRVRIHSPYTGLVEFSYNPGAPIANDLGQAFAKGDSIAVLLDGRGFALKVYSIEEYATDDPKVSGDRHGDGRT